MHVSCASSIRSKFVNAREIASGPHDFRKARGALPGSGRTAGTKPGAHACIRRHLYRCLTLAMPCCARAGTVDGMAPCKPADRCCCSYCGGPPGTANWCCGPAIWMAARGTCITYAGEQKEGPSLHFPATPCLHASCHGVFQGEIVPARLTLSSAQYLAF